ncbi:MAG: phospholipase D-like domain-containing protein [Candidatus Micrarchaeales archaeon]|jgi:hypothetical protein|nr:phospholipase D-like domain-containing protein [Candidatus Micrarchaeales archaeon]
MQLGAAVPERSYGSEAYKVINRIIKHGRELLLISPYIDEYYAAILKRESRKKHIFIISSSPTKEARNILLSRPLFSRVYALLSALFAAVAALSYWLFGMELAGFLLLFAAVACAFSAVKLRPHSRIHIKIPKRFVHIKMYTSEAGVVTGSANLTYSGTHRNIEQVELSTSAYEIEKSKRYFWKLWDSL